MQEKISIDIKEYNRLRIMQNRLSKSNKEMSMTISHQIKNKLSLNNIGKHFNIKISLSSNGFLALINEWRPVKLDWKKSAIKKEATVSPRQYNIVFGEYANNILQKYNAKVDLTI